MKNIIPPYELRDFNLNDKLLDDNETIGDIILAISFILDKITKIENDIKEDNRNEKTQLSPPNMK